MARPSLLPQHRRDVVVRAVIVLSEYMPYRFAYRYVAGIVGVKWENVEYWHRMFRRRYFAEIAQRIKKGELCQ